MIVDHAFLSDFASERSGYVGAMGIGIDTILAQELPTVHPHVFLVAQLRSSKDERGTFPLGLQFFDPDEKVLINQEGQVHFENAPEDRDGVARLVFGFYMLPLNRAGRYFFRIHDGKNVLSDVPLTVIVPDISPRPGAPSVRSKPSRKKKADSRG